MIENPVLRYGLLALALVYFAWSIGALDINWQRAANGIPRAANMLARMFPPDFSRWSLLFKGVMESVQMA
ncbi:MAG: hypothetical protein QNI97_13920, partial [Desulfobacterales bacterium]|nr:hypothetical protein [Desulfobacterales bacterium]